MMTTTTMICLVDVQMKNCQDIRWEDVCIVEQKSDHCMHLVLQMICLPACLDPKLASVHYGVVVALENLLEHQHSPCQPVDYFANRLFVEAYQEPAVVEVYQWLELCSLDFCHYFPERIISAHYFLCTLHYITFHFLYINSKKLIP